MIKVNVEGHIESPEGPYPRLMVQGDVIVLFKNRDQGTILSEEGQGVIVVNSKGFIEFNGSITLENGE